jgi:hypothetical protein
MPRFERMSERAVALPVAAFVLLSPPILGLFDRVTVLDGLPVIYLYLFGAWFALIALARALARRLLTLQRPVGRDQPLPDPAARPPQIAGREEP